MPTTTPRKAIDSTRGADRAQSANWVIEDLFKAYLRAVKKDNPGIFRKVQQIDPKTLEQIFRTAFTNGFHAGQSLPKLSNE